MIRTSAPLELPRRLTLATQAASALRQGILRQLWQEYLPSERRLCELLQVSRPTIRTALHALADEGLVEIRHGKRIRLVARPRPHAAARQPLVALISPEPTSRLPLNAYHGISEMRTQLAKHGFRTEEYVCLGRTAAAQRRRLADFLRQNRVFCCVLLSVNREVQEWITRHPIPALVLGSCHPDVCLPSLDVDYRAVCRHAVGVFRRHGHRRLALVVPASGAAGDLVSEEGFREGLAATPGQPGVTGTIVRHNGAPAHLAAGLDALFRSAAAPTALLVAKPAHTLAVLVYLLHRGIRVPDTVSVIARDHDQLFENLVSHYAFGGETFAHRLSRLMLQLVGQGRLPATPNLIFPRFVAMGTVQANRS